MCCRILTKRRMYDSGVDPNDPNAGGMHGGGIGGRLRRYGRHLQPRSSVARFGGGSAVARLPRTQPGRDALGFRDHRFEDGGVRRHHARQDQHVRPVPGVRRLRLPRTAHSPSHCPDCHGQGFMRRSVVRTMLGQMMTSAPCERCEGHGTVIENPCPSCMGHGRVRATRNVGVAVPAGIGEQRASASRQSGRGRRRRRRCRRLVRRHPHQGRISMFTRDGDDLHCWIQGADELGRIGARSRNRHLRRQADAGPSRPACQPDDTRDVEEPRRHASRRQGRARRSRRPRQWCRFPTKLTDDERALIERFGDDARHGRQHVAVKSRPPSGSEEGVLLPS